jgi:two-component system, response regulator
MTSSPRPQGTTTEAAPVLLIEDNPDDLESVRRSMRRHNVGSELVVATDGGEALNLFGPQGRFADRLPALILLDLRLPVIDGLEVLRRLADDPRTAATPVVVLAASEEDWDSVQSSGLGAAGYVTKPLDFQGLARAVQLADRSLEVGLPPSASAS